jgi:hypothetical protein
MIAERRRQAQILKQKNQALLKQSETPVNETVNHQNQGTVMLCCEMLTS